MKEAKDVLRENQISQYKYARKRQLVSMQNKLKETKMLLGLSTLAGVAFGGLSSWLLYPEISATTTIQNAAVMSIGAGGAVAIMFMAVPTIVYALERKNFKEFKKEYDEFEKNQ
ncbi:MAG: hypothetical protein IJF22_00045 [Clostridia bacterium]|nr:hypothetical protein [Clostridia bacterium]